MRRSLVPLVTVLPLVLTLGAFAQAPLPGPQGAQGAPLPGAPTPGLPAPGAQRPGTPPRDNAAQRPTTGTAVVRGRVIAAQTGMPLRRAQLTLTLVEQGQQLRRVTTSDADGRYQFTDLPAGRFQITAVKAGYVTLQYGQRRAFEAGTPVNVADGEKLERIDFTLPRGSVIAVRVTDEFGEPIAGIQVQVQRYQYGPDGQRRLTSTGSLTPFATTDDRGEFRAFGLMPGEYVVLASMRALGGLPGTGANDASEGFAQTFYPGVLTADQAQAISLGIGQEQPVQFGMIAARMGRVSGSIVDSGNRPASGAQLSIITVSGSGMSSSSAGTVGSDGTFALSGIAPGEHTLRVTYTRPGVANEFGSTTFVAGASDVTGLQIILGVGATIAGRVVYEGTAARNASGQQPRVSAQRTSPQEQFAFLGVTDPQANGTIDEEGHFKLAGQAGRVFLTMTPVPTGWTIKSIVHDGKDIIDVPLELYAPTTLSDVRITLTDKLTSVSGQVADGRGQPLSDYVVVVQPAEQKEPIVAARSIRVARPDTRGRFEVRGLRPGRYVATAIEALEQGRQYSPEFQKALRRGAKDFVIREGETIALDLRLTPDL